MKKPPMSPLFDATITQIKKTSLYITLGLFVVSILYIFAVLFFIQDENKVPWLIGGISLFTIIFIVQLTLFFWVLKNLLHIFKENYRVVIEKIPSIIYFDDAVSESLTIYISPQIEQRLGYTQNEFLHGPFTWEKIIHPEDRERVLAESQRTFQTKEPFKIEYRIISKSGVIIWVKDEATLIFDESQQPLYWLGVWTDITSIKESQRLQANAFEVLTRRTNQLQTASEISRAASSILDLNELLPQAVELIRNHFDYYYVGLFLVDKDFKILHLRAGTGETGKQLLAQNFSLEVGGASMVGWCAAHNQTRIALDVGDDAVRFKNPLLPLTRSEIALPLRARGHVIGVMTFQSEKEGAFTDSDITALQTMCDQIANAITNASLFDDRINLIKELEAKNIELERFTYTVSHDLKSPLVTMRGYLGYLSDSARKGNFERFDKDLDRVVNATNTMQNLLNDLLLLSRVGRAEETRKNVSVKNAIEEVLEITHDVYANKKVNIIIQDNLPTVIVNPTRLREVIQNLLVNAMKFSAHLPNPEIEIGTDGFDPASNYPILFIRDNGVGIDPQYHKQIFGLFNRLDNSIEGTGVGLTLVKRIVEMYGGNIWVKSEGKDTGTTFYFTLPPAN